MRWFGHVGPLERLLIAVVLLGGCGDVAPVDACPVTRKAATVRSLSDIGFSISVPAGWEEWQGGDGGGHWEAFASDPQQTVWVSLAAAPGLQASDVALDGTEIGGTDVVFADGQIRKARIVDTLIRGKALRSLEVVLPEEGRTRVVRASTPVEFADPCRALIAEMFSTIVLDDD